MANDDAWNQGWNQGMGASQKRNGRSGKKSKKKLDSITDSDGNVLKLDKFHKGGRVRKTGPAVLKKGEVVLTSSQAKAHGLKRGGKKKASGRKRTVVKA